jgi:predicted TIM-barrel fold metal-dependent hydrolase
MDVVPRIISTDDHVVEPPDLFRDRMPAALADRAPRVVRRKLRHIPNSKGRQWVPDDIDGRWCDTWEVEDLVLPLMSLLSAIGLDVVDVDVSTYDAIHPGAWKQTERLADMDANHVEAAMCFPNVFRFAGQTFSERADKDLAIACIRAYNDWILDDWAGGAARGRLLPVTVVPLWDVELAAAEIRRCADKGSFLATFPENPHPLGFPSLYTPRDYWAPFFHTCEETGTSVNMHIGSSSRMAHATPDAPYIVTSTQTYLNSQGSLLDFIFSGTLDRHPRLTISYAESQVGWVPYMAERADKLWEHRDANEFGSDLPMPPSHYLRDRVYFCMFDDEVGLRNRDLIGMSQIAFETDYPHPDTTFPHTKETFVKIADSSGLTSDERYQLARGNAIRAHDLKRYGITA